MSKRPAPEWIWWHVTAPERTCIFCKRPEHARFALVILDGPQLAGPVHEARGVQLHSSGVRGSSVCADHLVSFVRMLGERNQPITEAASA